MNGWIPLKDVLEVVTAEDWSWLRNNKCKYFEVRVDTRNFKCLIRDRNGQPITIDELKYQYHPTPETSLYSYEDEKQMDEDYGLDGW